MAGTPAVLSGEKDDFTIDFKVIRNTQTLVPNKKMSPEAEYGCLIVKISEASDFFGLGDFIEVEKVLFDLTPTMDGGFIASVTLCFIKPEEGFEVVEDENEEPEPSAIKLVTRVPPGAPTDFLRMVAEKKFYFVILSTPAYEGRMVIKHKTGLVSAKVYEERGYKIQ